MAGGKGADDGSPGVRMPCALRLCCAGRALGLGFGSICRAQRNAVPRCCVAALLCCRTAVLPRCCGWAYCRPSPAQQI